MALFKRNLIPLIHQGLKTHTRRTHKNEWKIGHTYKIKENYLDKGQGKILITRRFKQQLGNISLEDAKKEGFQTLEEFKSAWREINGNWNPNQTVTVYEFRLAAKTSKPSSATASQRS